MLKKVLVLGVVLVNLFTVVCYADDVEIEDFPSAEIWEEITDASSKNSNSLPSINSRAAVVFDRVSKTVLYGKNIDSKRAMASTTKTMTAILTLENGNLDEVIEVSKKAANTGGSRLGLKTGDKIKLRDLLYGLMLRSGNDAAVQIAIHLGGSVEGFAKMMNDKAKELGLKDTNFVTPHGLDDPKHYTTAYEMALLTDYALNNEEFAKIVNTKQTTIAINSNPVNIYNTNELLGNLEGVNGVKTGFTNNAGRCLVTSTTRSGWQIITVVFGADTKKFRTKDSIELIEYSFKNFQQVNIKESVEQEFEEWQEKNGKEIKIIKGEKEAVGMELQYQYDYELYPINKEKLNELQIQIECEEILESPVENNYQVGQVHVILEGKEIMSVPIVTECEVERKNIWDYFGEMMLNYTNIILQAFMSHSN